MVKKTKTTGKTRLDKFYHLAKEQGYRSRAAFKLVQLNRKYDFLKNAKAAIDLCAAPGGWLQVCSKFMPQNSIIVGVDLDPIRAIPRCLTFTEDITTQSCRSQLRKALNHWKVDVVLHDGSPNVGGAWAKDAYGQSELVLHATKLASEFLVENGTYVTKIFRSQDYNSLLWVMKQLFRNVDVTKPEASRSTSAEIYFVCQGYLAPKSIDPKIFDPNFVFKTTENDKLAGEDDLNKKKLTVNSLHKYIETEQRKRQGYEDGQMILHKTASVYEFITSSNPVNILGSYNALTFDDQSKELGLMDNKATTPDIVELIKDLRVLGKSDLRDLMKWHKKLREVVDIAKKKSEKETVDQEIVAAAEDVDSDEEETKKLEDYLKKLKKKAAARQKKQKRKAREQRVKAKQIGDFAEEAQSGDLEEMFSLKQLGSKSDLTAVVDDDNQQLPKGYMVGSSDEESDDEISEDENEDAISNSDDDSLDKRIKAMENELEQLYESYKERRNIQDRKMKKKMKELGIVDQEALESENESNSVASHSGDESPLVSEDEVVEDEIAQVDEGNPLEVKFDTDLTSAEKAAMWFDRDLLKDVDVTLSELVGEESSSTLTEEKPKDKVKAKANKSKPKRKFNMDVDSEAESADESKIKEQKDGEFEVVPKEEFVEEYPFSDEYDSDAVAERLAIGKAMLRKKNREKIVDEAFNKWTFNDDGADLPEWFQAEEEYHRRPNIPVTKEEVNAEKQKLMEINLRPIKKIAEAKARNRMRTAKRWEKVKSQAQHITENKDIPMQEKFKKLEKLYKNRGLRTEKKKDKVYMVTRKSGSKTAKGQSMRRGAQVVKVDKRMKKDKRGEKRAMAKGSSKGGSKNKRQRTR